MVELKERRSDGIGGRNKEIIFKETFFINLRVSKNEFILDPCLCSLYKNLIN